MDGFAWVDGHEDFSVPGAGPKPPLSETFYIRLGTDRSRAPPSDGLYPSRYDILKRSKIRLKDVRIFMVTFGVGVRCVAHVEISHSLCSE